MDTAPAITEERQMEDPMKGFFNANAVKDRQWYERDFRGKQYGYEEYWSAKQPLHHRQVAEMAILGRNLATIRKLSRLTEKEILKILNHEPVAAYVEYAFERARLKKEEFTKDKADTALEGFGVMRGIVKGELKPEKTRFDAAKHAMTLDPQGRFEPYAIENEQRVPLTTSSLKDFINKSKAIEAKYKEVEDEEDPQPDDAPIKELEHAES